MVRENQLQVLGDQEDYFCRACDRHFKFHIGAFNHCRHAEIHEGEWCERCGWLFVSPRACQSHVDNSSRHNVCTPCGMDFGTPALLESHDVDVHNKCTECCECFRAPDLLKAHDVLVHNLCIECGRYFRNINDLMQHKRTHLPLDIKCLGCDRLFSEFSAMMIHLESGTCESGIDRDDVDSYIFDTYVRNRAYVNQWEDHLKYQCPDCGSDFRFASALCQHVASNACNQQSKSTFWDLEKCITSRI
ncbi:uncharacterized protein Z520_05324 [Fonsecaea multimorphosa CBS 102226]|uniref:C2H2-type domain-containing protein n=1 Tax=Fonsecaea multimorphosa CBS 102226 TaxID=1442371 RepID=A0A0D2KQ86_9EURO|nr:uncharacterized protein Z520_05324 [Fonsecaea multimorphosa CBS 102226]KIX98863.1 hypothetical protein Z520_05324 [Fonsecaea multimorphosa CBS 102226]